MEFIITFQKNEACQNTYEVAGIFKYPFSHVRVISYLKGVLMVILIWNVLIFSLITQLRGQLEYMRLEN